MAKLAVEITKARGRDQIQAVRRRGAAQCQEGLRGLRLQRAAQLLELAHVSASSTG